jgi:hypothetical protein
MAVTEPTSTSPRNQRDNASAAPPKTAKTRDPEGACPAFASCLRVFPSAEDHQPTAPLAGACDVKPSYILTERSPDPSPRTHRLLSRGNENTVVIPSFSGTPHVPEHTDNKVRYDTSISGRVNSASVMPNAPRNG